VSCSHWEFLTPRRAGFDAQMALEDANRIARAELGVTLSDVEFFEKWDRAPFSQEGDHRGMYGAHCSGCGRVWIQIRDVAGMLEPACHEARHVHQARTRGWGYAASEAGERDAERWGREAAGRIALNMGAPW
jgi:hypothetical protein